MNLGHTRLQRDPTHPRLTSTQTRPSRWPPWR